MAQQSPSIRAWLVSNGKREPIETHHASKYSLWVRFIDSMRYSDGTEFLKLIIEADSETLEIGPCRLMSEPNIEGFAGRLVPVGDFHDFEALFFHNKIEKMTTDFVNLPLLMAHKNEIHPEFKSYVSDLTYDLAIFQNLFARLEQEYQQEPETVKRVVEHSIVETKGRELMRYLDDRLVDLERIVRAFTKPEHERHGFYFRKQLWNFILESTLMARTNLKPRGYAGDSEMMRMIYRNGYEGDTLFSRILNKHPMEHAGAQAVRNRRLTIADIIHGLPQPPSGERIRVLSVACGPAFEIHDILRTREDCARYSFTLFDQDQFALMEAAREIDDIERRLRARVDVAYLRESVRTMLFSPHLDEKWGHFDFIYSMGLFDYFTPPVAKATVKKLFQLAGPGAEIAIGNFHVDSPSRYYMEYWLDWSIYYRTEDDMVRLVAEQDVSSVQVDRDETGVQMLLRAWKADR